jgi:hypothetical protein
MVVGGSPPFRIFTVLNEVYAVLFFVEKLAIKRRFIIARLISKPEGFAGQKVTSAYPCRRSYVLCTMGKNNTETERTGETKRQYAAWLQGYYWDDMVTVTFRRPRKEPYYALKHVEQELIKCNAGRGFLVAEPFQSGDLHIHGIIAAPQPGWLPEMMLPWEIWERMYKRFGRARVQAANSREAVSMYCSKYILKQQSRVCDYYSVFGTAMNWKSGKLK